jgi:hypothetical protein
MYNMHIIEISNNTQIEIDGTWEQAAIRIEYVYGMG